MRIPTTSRSRGRTVIVLGVLLFLAGIVPAATAAVTPPTCAGKTATIWGGDADDTLDGTAGGDVIAGLGGRDTIHGGGGNDTICGGPGGDRIFGGGGNNGMYGEAGNDIIKGGGGRDTLNGGGGLDRLYGGDGSDTLVGGGGDDLIDGQGGANTANAGPGLDTCFNASDLNATCEPRWLSWDTGLISVGSGATGWSSLDLPEFVDVDGVTYYRSMRLTGDVYTNLNEWRSYDYVLGRDYRRFVFTIGIDDNSSEAAVSVRFQVFGDGVPLYSGDLAYGEHATVKLDVTGVLRLQLKFTSLGNVGGGKTLRAVWASPIVSANVGIAPYPPVG